MSRIVLTTIGSLGDLHPMIAIALELRDRGHEILFASTKDHQTRVEALGLKFSPIHPDPTTVDEVEMLTRMMDLQKGTERVIRDYILSCLRQTYEELFAIAQNADFIVSHEIVYATPLVAETLKLKWASLAMAPGAFFSAYDPLVLPPFPVLAKLRVFGAPVNRLVMDFARFVTRDWGEPIHQLRRELSLPPVGNPIIDDKFSPYLVLAIFSSVMGLPQPDWAANTVITGFPFYDGNVSNYQCPSELQQFLDEGEPPIVFTLGSAAVLAAGNFYEASLEAVQNLNRRAVLLIGNNPPPENLPESAIAIDYVPFSLIFPKAGAIVHQGGIGTSAQALRAGKPTIVVPYSHDQPDNAARLERLGTSRTIPRQRYTAERVTKELRELLNNPKYAAKASEVGEIIRSENGVQVACDAIEKQL